MTGPGIDLSSGEKRLRVFIVVMISQSLEYFVTKFHFAGWTNERRKRNTPP